MNCEIERNAPLTPWERLCVGALLLFALVGIAACCGCASAYKGGKAVDGFDAEVAIKPSSESQFTIQLAHILSGFVFYWVGVRRHQRREPLGHEGEGRAVRNYFGGQRLGIGSSRLHGFRSFAMQAGT